MPKIEARPVIEDSNFLGLEVQNVVQGFRTLWERPNLVARASTPEANKLSAILQAKKNRKEPWSAEDFEQICGIVFAGVDTPSLQKLRETIRDDVSAKGMDDIVDFLLLLRVGISAYVAGRVVEAEAEAWKRLPR